MVFLVEALGVQAKRMQVCRTVKVPYFLEMGQWGLI